MTQRQDDQLILERTNAFEKFIKDWFDAYYDERGQRWQDEENEGTQLEGEIPQQPLPSSLA